MSRSKRLGKRGRHRHRHRNRQSLSVFGFRCPIAIPIPTTEQKDLKLINVLEIDPYGLPDLSNFFCLPGRAGGSPHGLAAVLLEYRYFTNARCFSSSDQFTMMLILRRPPDADAGSIAWDSFIMRNRLPSGLTSHGVPEARPPEPTYVPRKRVLGIPGRKTGSVCSTTAITESPTQ